MLHSVILTNSELQAAGAFLILPDRGIFSVNDYLAVTIQDEEGKLTKSQVFFTLVNVATSETMRGVRKGYAMVKIKRTKNPLPKVDETEEIEDVNDESTK